MVEILVGDAVGDDDDADIGRTELVVDDRDELGLFVITIALHVTLSSSAPS